MTAPPATRRTLSQATAYALVGGIIGLALFASGTPSPIYGIYRELWGFSPLVLTLVYATYAFGVLGALLLAGRASDDVGRRPGPARRARRAHGGHGPLHGRRLGRLALRRARRAGPGHRRRPRRRQRLAARPPRPPRSGRRRADQRRGERRRHGPRRARLGGVRGVPARPARAALCRAVRALRDRLRRRLADARARRVALAPAADPAVAERSARGAPSLLPRRAGRDVLVVDRRPVPVAGPAALRRPLPHHQPPRGRGRRVRAGRLGGGRAARARAARRRGRARPPGRWRSPRAWC